jgi:GMP synthase (glutamine-hydrolysing)
MILIINTCKEELHYYDFVKPIEEIVKSSGKKYFMKHYSQVNLKDLENSERVIICGTALKDFEYDKEMASFSWLRGFEKPVLGICAGMQILVKIFDGNLKDKKEIGLMKVKFEREFLGIEKGKEVEVYSLHGKGILHLENFEARGKFQKEIQAIKMKNKSFYGVMFHPEARNKDIVRNFCLV